MSKRFFVLALCFVLVAALAFTGCAPARRPYDNNTNNATRTGYTGYGSGLNPTTNTGTGANPGTTGYSPGMNNGYGTANDYGYGTTGYGNRYGTSFGTYPNGGTATGTGYGTNYGTTGLTTSISDRIAIAARQIQGVQNATAVVTGNTAYVGVTIANNAGNTANANDIKTRVSQMVRATDTSITTVYVSTDAGFMNRLRTVDQGVRGGSPISGFTNELKNLVKGITPTR